MQNCALQDARLFSSVTFTPCNTDTPLVVLRVPGWNSIRLRILGAILLAFVPAAALLVQNNFARRASEADRIREETLRLVRLSVREQQRLFEDTRRVLASLAAHPAVRSANPSRCEHLLSSVVVTDPLVYGSLVVADTSGTVFCSAKPMTGPLNLLDRPYVQEALRTRGFTVSDYQVARLTKRNIMGFGYAVTDDVSQVRGVVALALGLDWFSDLAAFAQLPRGSDVLIVDRHRAVLSHLPSGSGWIGKRVADDAALTPLLDGGEAVMEAEGLDGVRRLYGVSHVVSGHSRIATAVGMPLDALADANQTLYRGLIALGVIGMVTLGLAWAGLAAFVIKPLDSLRAATHEVASGDMSHRVVLKGGLEELDAVARDFDGMAWTLQKRDAEEFRAREALREAEEKYRHLVEQSLAGVYLVQAGRVAYVNPRCAEMFGYTPDELIGRPLLDFIHEPDRPLVAQNVAKRLSGEVDTMSYSLRGRRKDGSLITVHVHGTRTTYRGEPAITGIMIDRTQQKLLEQQLLQAQKMEAVGRLAGGVAHDFNNLLTVITGYSEFLAHTLPESSPERGHVEEIHKAAESAANLTRQLLAFSRKQVLQPEILSLNKVVAGFEKMLRRLIGEDIRVMLKLDPDLALAKVDPGQVEQVIMNLAVNARDAMPNGGSLTIETTNVTLDEEYVRLHAGASVGPHVTLTVSDTGTGMTPEIQTRVFEPFFTTKERDRGTGLGLSTVYGIVKQSGGSIWLYSEPGRGTTFKIFFPIADATIVRDTTAAPNEVDLSGTETIVVVEDNASLRTWVAEALGKRGYTVIPLGTPGDALAMTIAGGAPVHLLLTDVILPSMNGPDLAARLTKRWPTLRILYMSGYTDEAIAAHRLLPPGESVLQKPFTSHDLSVRVRAVLSTDIQHRAQP